MSRATCPAEDTEQALVIRWATGQLATWPELALLFHPANGEKRGKLTAAKLKRMGVKPGVPDLLLPVPRGGYVGLAVELKRRDGGRVSPEQRAWHAALAEFGHCVAVAEGHEAAIAVIRDYLAADGAPESAETAQDVPQAPRSIDPIPPQHRSAA